MVLSAGERRAYTANDIFRDPTWRKRDADGALRVSVEDAQTLGLVAGGRARITTVTGSAEATVEISEAMLPGHASLPNGMGLDFVDDDGQTLVPGVAPNALTSTEWRDAYAGTPWHKHVPARIEASPATRRAPFAATACFPPQAGVCPGSARFVLTGPDPNPSLPLYGQRVFLVFLERLVEGVEVADDAVAAELRRRVRIRRQGAGCFRVTRFGAPTCAQPIEHALHAGEAVDDGRRLPFSNSW